MSSVFVEVLDMKIGEKKAEMLRARELLQSINRELENLIKDRAAMLRSIEVADRLLKEDNATDAPS